MCCDDFGASSLEGRWTSYLKYQPQETKICQKVNETLFGIVVKLEHLVLDEALFRVFIVCLESQRNCLEVFREVYFLKMK